VFPYFKISINTMTLGGLAGGDRRAGRCMRLSMGERLSRRLRENRETCGSPAAGAEVSLSRVDVRAEIRSCLATIMRGALCSFRGSR
jgi:hypothetical protein